MAGGRPRQETAPAKTHSPSATIPDGADAAADPTLSADWSDGYRVGCEHGYRQGVTDAEADLAEAWRAFAEPTAAALARSVGLRQRRWQVRGEARTQETFGASHPDDYPGQGGTAA